MILIINLINKIYSYMRGINMYLLYFLIGRIYYTLRILNNYLFSLEHSHQRL